MELEGEQLNKFDLLYYLWSFDKILYFEINDFKSSIN